MPLPGTTGNDDNESDPALPDTLSIPQDEIIQPVVIPDSITVLVLNGTEIDGLAGRTQWNLLRASTDSLVILTPFDPSNTELKPFAETIIVSHIPDLTSARIVAEILDRPQDCIVWEVPQDGLIPIVDITVCLGQDMENMAPAEN